jgi:hypothetical protein
MNVGYSERANARALLGLMVLSARDVFVERRAESVEGGISAEQMPARGLFG